MLIKFMESVYINQSNMVSGWEDPASLLHNYYDIIAEELENKHNVHMIYTDCAKAFDKCEHGVIVHKMHEMGMIG